MGSRRPTQTDPGSAQNPSPLFSVESDSQVFTSTVVTRNPPGLFLPLVLGKVALGFVLRSAFLVCPLFAQVGSHSCHTGVCGPEGAGALATAAPTGVRVLLLALGGRWRCTVLQTQYRHRRALSGAWKCSDCPRRASPVPPPPPCPRRTRSLPPSVARPLICTPDPDLWWGRGPVQNCSAGSRPQCCSQSLVTGDHHQASACCQHAHFSRHLVPGLAVAERPAQAAHWPAPLRAHAPPWEGAGGRPSLPAGLPLELGSSRSTLQPGSSHALLESALRRPVSLLGWSPDARSSQAELAQGALRPHHPPHPSAHCPAPACPFLPASCLLVVLDCAAPTASVLGSFFLWLFLCPPGHCSSPCMCPASFRIALPRGPACPTSSSGTCSGPLSPWSSFSCPPKQRWSLPPAPFCPFPPLSCTRLQLILLLSDAQELGGGAPGLSPQASSRAW